MIDFNNPSDVAALKYAVMWGYVSQDKCIAAVDDVILHSQNEPSIFLYELSLSKSKNDFYIALDQMACGFERLKSIRLFLKKYTQNKLSEDDEIFYLAGCLAGHIEWEDDSMFVDMKTLYHELRDAKIGVYGDFNLLCEEYKKLIIQLCEGEI